MFLSDEQNNNDVMIIAPHTEPELNWEELKTMDNISINSNESDLVYTDVLEFLVKCNK